MVTALIDYLTVLLEYLTVLLDMSIGKSWEGRGPATPEFGHVTAWCTRVSTVLKVLSLNFNTPLIIYAYRRS